MLTTYRALIAAILLNLAPIAHLSAQPLETETARLPAAGHFEAIANFEYQTSAEGTEMAMPLELALGATDNLEFLVEPVPYTAIRPKVGRIASGLGDLETTVTYRFLQETPSMPAMALAGEIKFPVAKDTLIGTGKTDYTLYLIASKRLGDIDAHANFGYAVLGNPTGLKLDNILSGSLAVEYHVDPKFDVVGEVFASTSALPESATEGQTIETTTSPEVAGGEVFGTIGARYHVQADIVLALGISYDNQNALLIRPGIGVKF